MENNQPMTWRHVQKDVNVQFFKALWFKIGVLKMGFGLVADYHIKA
jgi:hypothetical protein